MCGWEIYVWALSLRKRLWAVNLDLVGDGSVALSRHFPQKEWLIFLHQELLKVESRILKETANYPKGSFLFRSQCKPARSKLNCATWPKLYSYCKLAITRTRSKHLKLCSSPQARLPASLSPFSSSSLNLYRKHYDLILWWEQSLWRTNRDSSIVVLH